MRKTLSSIRMTNNVYLFIVNLNAGNGRAKRLYREVMNSELLKQIHAVCYFTDGNNDSEQINRFIKRTLHSQDITALIIVGGDGTIHEVINGIDDFSIPIAVIPAGSGNDFIRGTSISRGTVDQILNNVINEPKERYFCPGTYKIDGNERCFVNSIGVGFDAEVTAVANKSIYKGLLNRLKLGSLAYVIALIQVLINFKPKTVTLNIDGVTRKLKDCWMINVANHPYFGGGMKINPEARIESEHVSIIIIHSISKRKVLAVFGTVFVGTHTRFKEVELLRARQVELSFDHVTAYQADGETGLAKDYTIAKKQDRIRLIGVP